MYEKAHPLWYMPAYSLIHECCYQWHKEGLSGQAIERWNEKTQRSRTYIQFLHKIKINQPSDVRIDMAKNRTFQSFLKGTKRYHHYKPIPALIRLQDHLWYQHR